MTFFGDVRRLKYAIKYLFGYQCKYGAFDEIILGTKQYNNIKGIVRYENRKIA